MKTRTELDCSLDKLETALPGMIEQYDEAKLMDAFSGEMEMIEEDTAVGDSGHLFSRTQCMLRNAGLIPSDDDPCSE